MVKHARTVSSMMEHGDFTHAFSNRLGTICCAPLVVVEHVVLLLQIAHPCHHQLGLDLRKHRHERQRAIT
jgi:hypothetical protein